MPVATKDSARFAELYVELQLHLDKQAALRRREELRGCLEKQAQGLYDSIAEDAGNLGWNTRMQRFSEAWDWACTTAYFFDNPVDGYGEVYADDTNLAKQENSLIVEITSLEVG